MALAPNRSRARRTRFSSIADQLYPEDDLQEPVTVAPDEPAGDEQDGTAGEDPAQPMSQKDMADKVYPAKIGNNDGFMPPASESDSCHKPEDDFDRITRIAHNRGAHPDMGPLEYAGKFWISGAKGMYSLVQDVLAGSRDAAAYLGNLSGLNGEEAQNKAHSQLNGALDDTQKGGAAVYNGLRMYYTSPEVRDAVNGAIVKAAPHIADKALQALGDVVDDPDRSGRVAGRLILSKGISKIDEIPQAAKYFISAMALIGNLNATDKNMQSKIEGLLLGADYPGRSTGQPGK